MVGYSIKSRIADIIIHICLVFSALATLFPFWHVLCVSITGYKAYATTPLLFYPKDITLEAYNIIKDPSLLKSFGLTMLLVAAFTLLHAIVCVITAYPISKKYLPGRNFMILLVVFPMIFSGGIIPTYLVIKDLHLTNTFAILVLAGMFSGFNIVLMKNFFGQIPESLEDAAKIDGAGDYRILFEIYLPLCIPIIATVSLFAAVSKWNDYFTAQMYITKQSLYPLQNVLREMIIEGNVDTASGGALDTERMQLSVSIKMAVIMIATIPVVCIYPFVQKHFVKGVMVGSVKG